MNPDEAVLNAISSGLENLFRPNNEKTTVATLKWKVRGGPEKEAKVDFCSVAPGRIGALYRKFDLTIGGNEYRTYVSRCFPSDNYITLSLVFTRENTSFNTRANIGLDVAEFENDQEVLAREVRIAPYDTPDVSFIANAWFSDQGFENAGGMERCKAQVEKPFECYWPKFSKDENQWVMRVPSRVDGVNPVHDYNKEWANFCVVLAARAVILKETYEDNYNLPYYEEYRPKRPVDLETNTVEERLQADGISIPWRIIETACASLNANKHVIFTGPPGCGKTTLAKVLAQCAGINDPMIVTASPTWSTDEVIGRYMPDQSGQGIKFSEGFFLRAINEDKWLIIDELNRADIDSCFGELFTVLSGQPAILPFEKPSQDDEDNATSEPHPIVILPEGSKAGSLYKQYSKYAVQSKFRMIGTMNDADASRLNQLSYAFQRRFNIIRVEAPSADNTKKLIKERTDVRVRGMVNTGRSIYRSLENPVPRFSEELLNALFASGNHDLIQQRVVGIAQALDVIDFMVEGLSAHENANLTVGRGAEARRQRVVYSYIALGLTMSVFPQLMVLATPNDQEKLRAVIAHVINSFGDFNFHRIQSQGNNYEIFVEGRSIANYLKEELRRLFRHTNLQPEVFDLIKSPPTNG
jgi:DNA polymerase III delta prime subunit